MKFVLQLKKYWYLLLLAIFCLIFFFSKKDKTDPIEFTDSLEVISQTEIIKVDIKGAVKNPGLYELATENRVADVIEKAGGLLDNADTSMINLSKMVTNEMVIIIYTKEEIASMKEGNTAIFPLDQECICPSVKNDGCIDETKIESNAPSTSLHKVSLNSATLEELMTLPGIGEVKAKEIIQYRSKNGFFKDIYELINVKGIGESTFDKIKEYLTI